MSAIAVSKSLSTKRLRSSVSCTYLSASSVSIGWGSLRSRISFTTCSSLLLSLLTPHRWLALRHSLLAPQTRQDVTLPGIGPRFRVSRLINHEGQRFKDVNIRGTFLMFEKERPQERFKPPPPCRGESMARSSCPRRHMPGRAGKQCELFASEAMALGPEALSRPAAFPSRAIREYAELRNGRERSTLNRPTFSLRRMPLPSSRVHWIRRLALLDYPRPVQMRTSRRPA